MASNQIKNDPYTNGSYFTKWYNKEIQNLGSFDTQLFQLWLVADGGNRNRLEKAFPRHFSPKKN